MFYEVFCSTIARTSDRATKPELSNSCVEILTKSGIPKPILIDSEKNLLLISEHM